jgi:iron complex outermembrane receptor protein
VINDAYKLIALPDFFQFDAHVGYTWNKLVFRLKATNLLNQLSYQAHDDNSINPIAPRQFSTTLAYKF